MDNTFYDLTIKQFKIINDLTISKSLTIRFHDFYNFYDFNYLNGFKIVKSPKNAILEILKLLNRKNMFNVNDLIRFDFKIYNLTIL